MEMFSGSIACFPFEVGGVETLTGHKPAAPIEWFSMQDICTNYQLIIP